MTNNDFFRSTLYGLNRHLIRKIGCRDELFLLEQDDRIVELSCLKHDILVKAEKIEKGLSITYLSKKDYFNKKELEKLLQDTVQKLAYYAKPIKKVNFFLSEDYDSCEVGAVDELGKVVVTCI